ncbi:unnamed protein product [Arabis nemorensis]|uniref:Uncharacterized protein n=1 Tax=Arabis nemorensis TaxID=586526 RepID=A0A565BNG4_9BRAS|nr:unnamed protein product [Arabis nemorensis]
MTSRFISHWLTCLTNLTESLLKFREIQAQIQIKAHIEAMIHTVIEVGIE